MLQKGQSFLRKKELGKRDLHSNDYKILMVSFSLKNRIN